MEFNSLTPAALRAAASRVPEGPVTMLNLVRFRDELAYPEGFENRQPTPRAAYYEGYAGAFRAVAKALGILDIELVFRGGIAAALVAAPEDRWDDVVLVRYRSFDALCTILESPDYERLADPHRRAAVRDWRFYAMPAAA
jgi:hypothetical protein